ncbi:MAG: antirestriction protein [Polaromonas sp.]|nr:antirestriction protein [Polaromonas sp.]
MNTTNNVSSHLVPEADRLAFVDKLFGINFPMRLEPTVFDMAARLAVEYNGGYWAFYALSNGGFYMAPRTDTIFEVSCENGFEGKLSADALGIAACLYAYSHLSFGEGAFAETVSQHYHLLREYMMGHPEVRGILGAID